MATRSFEKELRKDLQYIPLEAAGEGNLLYFSTRSHCELALGLETRAQISCLLQDCTVFTMIMQYSNILPICFIPKKNLDQLTTAKNLVG